MSDAGLVGGGQLGEVPLLRPHPGAAALFARREERLRALAPGHAAGDYLEFLARLARAQRAAAERWRPAPSELAPPPQRPLDVARGPLPGWQEPLALLLATLADAPMPAAARQAVARLGRLPPADLGALARRLLAGGPLPGADLAAAPLAGAGLQVAYAVRAAAVPPAGVARTAEGCPVCGAPPVVGLVLGDDKLRYLVCGLCASAWHHTRVQCVLCRSAARLSYLSIEGDEGPAKAECCEGCRAWLKLLYVERAPGLEPVADDVATLALDLLVAERGLRRLGPNVLLAAAGAKGVATATA